MRPFIPKDDNEIPDFYKITIHYINGKKEEFEISELRRIDVLEIQDPHGPFKKKIKDKEISFKLEASPSPFYEFVTHEDIWHVVPILSILKIEYDKNFSKMMALNEKKGAENVS